MSGHYLSPVVGWGAGGRAEDFRGGHLIFGRTKGGSAVTENPKGGIDENFGRIQRGEMFIEGRSRKSSNVIIRWDHFSEVTFKWGIG